MEVDAEGRVRGMKVCRVVYLFYRNRTWYAMYNCDVQVVNAVGCFKGMQVCSESIKGIVGLVGIVSMISAIRQRVRLYVCMCIVGIGTGKYREGTSRVA